MRDSKFSFRLKVFIVISLTLSVGLFIYTLIVNSGIRDIENSRDTSLHVLEATKLWVVEDIRDYLLIRDKETYDMAKSFVHMSSELKKELFGNSFEGFRLTDIQSVSFVDAQYSLDSEEDIKIYLLVNVERPEGVSQLNFVVSVKDNTIYDLLAY